MKPARSTDGTPNSAGNRPTLRVIAEKAGVSAMTVSLALRNDCRLKPATRQRVRQIARLFGYRPNPSLVKLMRHLRGSGSGINIGVLTDFPCPVSRPDVAAMIQGARNRAEALGYGFDLLCLDHPTSASQRQLRRIISGRGIEAVVVLPLTSFRELGDTLDWSRLAAVAATTCALNPSLQRVLPNDFENTKLLCRELTRLGCKRIGLATTHESDARTQNHLSAAMAWHDSFVASDPIPPFVHPSLRGPDLAGWIEEYRPDAIISHTPDELTEIQQILHPGQSNRIGLACVRTCRSASRPAFAGIDIRPEEIGRVSIEIVAKKVECGERGIEPLASTITIEGCWWDGSAAGFQLEPHLVA